LVQESVSAQRSEEQNNLPPPGNEPRYSGLTSRGLVAVLTEFFRSL